MCEAGDFCRELERLDDDFYAGVPDKAKEELERVFKAMRENSGPYMCCWRWNKCFTSVGADKAGCSRLEITRELVMNCEFMLNHRIGA